MSEIVFATFAGFIWQTVRFCVRKSRAPKAQPLCVNCFFAHVQYAANARLAVSCTFGGTVRPMKLDVLYCTDYRARDLASRAGVMGFVHEIAPAN